MQEAMKIEERLQARQRRTPEEFTEVCEGFLAMIKPKAGGSTWT